MPSKGLSAGPTAAAVLKARVRAAPSDGEANAALCRLIAGALDVAPRDVTIAAGATSRVKRVRVEGRAAAIVAALRRRLTDNRVQRSALPHRQHCRSAFQLFQPKATLSSTRVPNFSDERATVLPPSAR